MNLSPKVKSARDYAVKKHADQKYGEHPYSFHLDSVYNIVVEMQLGEDYEIAAFLHDVLEDTETTKEEIEQEFGTHIANLVDAVSGFGATRHERHEDMKRKIVQYPLAINLKMSDRLANLRSSKINIPKLFLTYRKEHDSLISIFSQGNALLFEAMEEILEIKKIKNLKP